MNKRMKDVKDLTPLLSNYRGKWVALKSDESTVISSGKTAKVAWNTAKKKGFENPILFKVPFEVVSYIG